MTTPEVWTGTYDDLPLGAREESVQVIDGAAIDAFAHAIKSYNPIHMDGDWTRANTRYPDRIAHGVMTTALMSQPLVQFCERFRIRTALLSTQSKYIRPVVAGDAITTAIELVEKIDARKRIRFTVEARNQRGDVVMIGELVEQTL